MAKCIPLITFYTKDGRTIEATAKTAAGIARFLSYDGNMADWKPNKQHPDWLAAEFAITGYYRFLKERKTWRRFA